jgi:hypothetical protein
MADIEKISFIGLLLLILSLAGLLVYHRDELMQPVSRDKNPFRSRGEDSYNR